MSEHSPTPDHRYTDDDLIDRELDLAEDMEERINDATAKVIASQLHGGQGSDLYAFTSTGFISNGLMQEIDDAYQEFKDDELVKRRVAHLAVYLAARMCQPGGTAKVEGWQQLWLEASDERDDLCPCCFEPIIKPHRIGCPLGVDDEAQLERVQQLQAESGVHILHWLSYVGFRNLDELDEAADRFADHYHGFYDSVLDYAEEIAANLDNPPPVRELVVEINRTMYIAEGLHGGVYIYDK